MITGRFYVKGSRIKQENVDGWFTIDEVCDLLNKQDQQLERLGDEVFDLKQLLLQCNREFRKYDGRKLFDLEYIIFADILLKIQTLVFDPNEEV